jgi:cytochrome P450 family 110
MKTIPTANETFTPLSNLYSAFRPLDFIEAYTKKYGDFYRLKVSNNPSIIVVSNPQAVKEIFAASSSIFESAQANKILNFLLGDNAVLLLDGEVHRNRRRLLMPPFHGESLQNNSDKIVEITQQVFSSLQINHPFKVRDCMQKITLRVILNLVFGLNSGAKFERLRKLLIELLETFNTPWKSLLLIFPILQKDLGMYSPWGYFLRLKAEIRQIIYQEIKDRRSLLEKKSHQDILSLLLLAKDEQGNGMTDEELHDELITLLFAGHETTASALSWLLYWIHYAPEVQAKLRSELNLCGENIDYKKINHLSYLDAVVSETLRIYPVIAGAFARIPTQAISILGYQLKHDDWLSISIYALHHREDLYPDAKQFKPERFLERTYSPNEYIPFGGGNRRCIGSALALLEMKLVTVTVLSQLQLALTNKRPLYPVRRGITLAPPASFKMVIKQK